ncbi:MAG: hypothetical protein N5P05_004508 (plasmid) [Chroococcopsis gigantea SAG 12.99]|jgi:hypothetical protein|nr:hypothetical protein [Chroococcopsis gigantea SAG 12.99]
MRAGKIFESLLEKDLYEEDGTVKPDYREYLEKNGCSEEDIQKFERYQKHEIEMRKLIARANVYPQTPRDRAIARAGLDTEELLSQGYIDVEDLASGSDIDDFDIEELL